MGEAVEDDSLATSLAALGRTTRIALLRALCMPRVARDVAPDAEAHRELNELVGLALVIERVDPEGEPTYVLDHARLFVVAEQLRALAQLRPDAEVALAARDAPTRDVNDEPGSASLVLVHGLEIGRTFPLTPRRADARDAWVIGRGRGHAIALDHDALLAGECAVVRWEKGAHVLHDLAQDGGGTSLNFQLLPGGGARRLATGDLVGVGRSLLLYRRGARRRLRGGLAGRSLEARL